MTHPDIFGASEGDYQIICKTDTLAPEIVVGDQLIVRPQKTAEAGEIVVSAAEDGDWTIGYWPGVGGTVVARVIGVYRRLA